MVHRLATKEKVKNQRTTKQKVTGSHGKEESKYLEQDTIGQKKVSTWSRTPLDRPLWRENIPCVSLVSTRKEAR